MQARAQSSRFGSRTLAPGLAAAVALILALGLAAGCARIAEWEKPGASRDQYAFDVQTCRSRVRARLNSSLYYAREEFHSRAINVGDIVNDEKAGVQRRLLEADRWRLRERLLAECLVAKGYRRVDRDQEG